MNTSEVKKRGQNVKSGGEVAEQSGGARISKSHSDYWRTRIFKSAYTRDGKRIELPDYSVRIQTQGRRAEFTLGPNAAKSTEQARSIFVFIEANGWPSAIAKFKPKAEAVKKSATVGEVITAAGSLATVKPRTLAAYKSALRQIAADLAKIKGDATRFAYKSPAFAEWRAKVDAVPLSIFTPEAVADWRARRIAAHVADPVAKRSAEITADSVIRTAHGIFGKKLAGLIRRTVALPDQLPFTGLSLKKPTRRFRADVNPEWLFNAARAELETEHPEQFKALCLCLLAGLRRAEADCLTWAQIDLEGGTVSIRETPYFSPKSEESSREIDLSSETVDMFRKFKAMPQPDPLFVLRGGKAKPLCKFQYYRADRHPHKTWIGLRGWLTSKGITAQKPVHALRKHAGSLIHARHGIEAARTFLGHTDIETTSASYLDKKPRVSVNLGASTNESHRFNHESAILSENAK